MTCSIRTGVLVTGHYLVRWTYTADNGEKSIECAQFKNASEALEKVKTLWEELHPAVKRLTLQTIAQDL